MRDYLLEWYHRCAYQSLLLSVACLEAKTHLMSRMFCGTCVGHSEHTVLINMRIWTEMVIKTSASFNPLTRGNISLLYINSLFILQDIFIIVGILLVLYVLHYDLFLLSYVKRSN